MLILIEVKNGDIEKALKLFKKRTFDSGHIRELKQRKEYEKPAIKKRKEKQKAIWLEFIKSVKNQHFIGNFSNDLPIKRINK